MLWTYAVLNKWTTIGHKVVCGKQSTIHVEQEMWRKWKPHFFLHNNSQLSYKSGAHEVYKMVSSPFEEVKKYGYIFSITNNFSTALKDNWKERNFSESSIILMPSEYLDLTFSTKWSMNGWKL